MPVDIYPFGGPVLIEATVKIDGLIHVCSFTAIRGEVEIGDGTQISHNTTIISNSHVMEVGAPIVDQLVFHKPIKIGRDVLIGAGVVILGGCVIEDGAVIGAGSVVPEDTHIGADQIWCGVPAKFQKRRSCTQVA